MGEGMELSEWHMWWKRRGAQGIRRLLMEEWDPIGVADVPEAADEYDAYLGAIGERLRRGANADEIARFLTDVREDRMGLGPSPSSERSQDMAVADRLTDWYVDEMRLAGGA
jgi:hypothetical protein